MGKWHSDGPEPASNYRRFGTFRAQEDGSQTLVIYARSQPDAWVQSDTYVYPEDAPARSAEDA